jgi:orotidine-5'-phosphate decarboxylase
MPAAFADRLIEATRRTGPLCVGLDPIAEHIPALFGRDERAIAPFLTEILDLAVDRAAAVKPQLGFFEASGAEGFRLAHELTREAQGRGLIVLVDGKRGDVGSTAEGYARALLGAKPGFDADAATVNPYLGLDSLEPFLKAAEDRRKGVAVLVRTSNPGARDIQGLQADGAPVWTHVARMIAPETDRLAGESGWSGLMAVAGATWPAEAQELRRLLPRSLFLVPGYGAQGAGARDAVAGFVPGPHGRLEGGIVSSSRAILYPHGAQTASSLDDWRALVGQAMDRAKVDLEAAIAR